MNRPSSITLIVAMSRNRVIGRKGALPWHLPADLARFKQRTMGHAVIMGRKTWAGIPEKFRPLPGRSNIVISRDRTFLARGATVMHSFDDAVHTAEHEFPEGGEIFVAGGAEIYRVALPEAGRIDLTLVETSIADGDAFFPVFENDPAWRLVREDSHAADDRHAFGFAFREYVRKRASNVR